MIKEALGLEARTWYECPKGHVYAIGNCGQADQESKCPECGARIGGVGHRLDQNNRVSNFMN